MISLLFQSLLDFKNAWRKHLGFGLFSLFLTSILFAPLFAYLFQRILLTFHSGVVLNREVFALLLNYRSALSLFLLAVLVVFVMTVEMGVFLLIAHRTQEGEPVLVADALLTTLKALPRLLGFEVVYLVFLVFAVLPLVKLPVEPALSGRLEAPRLLMESIMGSPLYRGLYLLALAGLTYLLLRWIFTLHGVLLRRQRIRAAMKTSAHLTHRLRIALFLKLLLVNLFFLGLGTALLAGLSMVPEWTGISVRYPVRQFFLTLAGLLGFVYALILMPLNMIVLTRLYKDAGERAGLPPARELHWIHVGWMARVEERIHTLFMKRRVLLLAVLSVNLFLTVVAVYSVNDILLYQGRDVAVAAHRGGTKDAPENSLSAIAASLAMGVDIIEVDVQMTKDGVLVLHHDLSLIRMAGVPNSVADLTFKELQELEIGSRGHPKYVGEPIPTLEDALELIGDEAMVLLDIKDFGEGAAMAKVLVERLEALGRVDTVYVQAFDPGFLRSLRQLNAEIRIGQILYYALGPLSRLDVDFYTVEKGMLHRDLVAQIRRADRQIYVWTIRTEEDLKEVLQFDIDGVIVTDVAMSLSILRPEPVLFLEEDSMGEDG